MSDSETYYVVAGSKLKGIADAIRAQGGTEADLEFADGFEAAIGNLPRLKITTKSGGGSTSLSFTDMPGAPKAFVLYSAAMNVSKSSSSSTTIRYVCRVAYNGSSTSAAGLYAGASGSGNSAQGTAYIAGVNGATFTYNSGTFTISMGSSSEYKFKSNTTYYLYYIY